MKAIKELKENIQEETRRLQMLDYPSPNSYNDLDNMKKDLRKMQEKNHDQKKQNMKLIQYLQEGSYLPNFLKDFHDQKNLFRTIYIQYKGKHENNKILDTINWVDTHILTIDIFLWWMGSHGYKLQKDRTKNVKFYNPSDSMEYYTNLPEAKEYDDNIDRINVKSDRVALNQLKDFSRKNISLSLRLELEDIIERL